MRKKVGVAEMLWLAPFIRSGGEGLLWLDYLARARMKQESGLSEVACHHSNALGRKRKVGLLIR